MSTYVRTLAFGTMYNMVEFVVRGSRQAVASRGQGK